MHLGEPHERPPAAGGPEAPRSRRKFLRQAGFTAATAAVVGLTDVVGMKPASAATRAGAAPTLKPSAASLTLPIGRLSPGTAQRVRDGRAKAGAVHPDVICCVLDEGQCGSPCTPRGVEFCHVCCDEFGHCQHFCINGTGSPCFGG